MIGSGIHSDYLTDVARGVYPDKIPWNAFGEKVATGADSGLLWSNGALSITPNTPVSIEIFSSSGSDTSGGTGINSVEVHYINSNWDEVAITDTLTGVTPKTIIVSDCRFLQCVHMDIVGAGLAAAGNITLRVSGGGATYGYIEQGETICLSSARMVPSGKRLLVYGAVASGISGTAAAEVNVRLAGTRIYTHEYIDPPIFIPYAALGFQDNSFGKNFPIPFVIAEKNIFGMIFTTDKAAIISGSWWGVLENA